jgi:hypothetical protein
MQGLLTAARDSRCCCKQRPEGTQFTWSFADQQRTAMNVTEQLRKEWDSAASAVHGANAQVIARAVSAREFAGSNRGSNETAVRCLEPHNLSAGPAGNVGSRLTAEEDQRDAGLLRGRPRVGRLTRVGARARECSPRATPLRDQPVAVAGMLPGSLHGWRRSAGASGSQGTREGLEELSELDAAVRPGGDEGAVNRRQSEAGELADAAAAGVVVER